MTHLGDTKHFVNELARECAFGKYGGWPPAAHPEDTIEKWAAEFGEEVYHEHDDMISRTDAFVRHIRGIEPLFNAHRFDEYYTNLFMEIGLRKIFQMRKDEMSEQQRNEWEERLDPSSIEIPAEFLGE